MVAGVTGHGGLIGAGGPVDRGVLWPLRGVPKASLESRSSAVKGGFGGVTSLLPCVSTGTFSS